MIPDRFGEQRFLSEVLDNVVRLPVAGWGSVDDGAHLRQQVPEGDLLRRACEVVLELADGSLFLDGGFGEITQDDVPVGILGVKLAQAVVDADL